jgi:RecJ-like exonuclease
MAEILYEWLVFNKDQEYILTEKQHRFLIDNQDKRFVEFPNFVIQPGMVSSMTKRPAQELKKMYPCKACHTTGQIDYKECADCGGMGVKLP